MKGKVRAGWRRARLKEVCSRITVGHVGPMADQYVDEGIIFLRSQDVHPFHIDFDGAKRISPDFHRKLKKSALQPGDVAIVRTGYPGTAAVVPSSVTVANCADLVIATPGPNLDPWFLCAVFNSAWGRSSVSGSLVGVAQQHFNVGVAKEMEVLLPSISGQRRIGSILSNYDHLIANNMRRLGILEEMAQRVFDEWFVQFRFPAAKHGQLVETNLGRVPRGWATMPLSDLCNRITDGSHFSPPSVETGFPMASVKDMHDWDLDISTCRRITEADYNVLVHNNCKPLVGDILIAKDGSYLKHTFVVREERELVLLSSIAILRPNGALAADILALTLQHPSTSARMKGFVSGVAIPRIVLKDFRRFEVLVPPKELQDRFLRLVGPALRGCWTLSRTNELLRQARDLLLPKLISGEIEVGDVEVPSEAEAA